MVEKKKVYRYRPDYAVAPGETVRETIEHYGMSQAELARRTGRPKKTINEIIQAKAAITPETALQFERVLGVPATFWNNLERNYREALARRAEEERLQRQLKWLDRVPWREMARRHWIRRCEEPVDQLREILSFFGVATPEAWNDMWLSRAASFRRSPAFEASPWAVSAWLRRAELEAQGIECHPYRRERFQAALRSLRRLTRKPPETFVPEIRKRCADSGVAVVFVRELPESRVSGAARWLTPRKAMIGLSLRYRSDDHFWFSFFHEAGHVLLHGKRDVFVDDGDPADVDTKEAAADRFSADFLIPPGALAATGDGGAFDEERVRQIAAGLGIAPGIVVGRLQHDKRIPFNRLNHLKRRLDRGLFLET